MAGLLYKDFIAVKGKWYVILMAVSFLLMLVLRIVLPTDKGDVIVFLLASFIVIILLAVVFFHLETSVVAVDEGRRRKCYCFSLPVSERQYVASKYIFILLAFYVVTSFSMMSGLLCAVNSKNAEMLMQSTMLQQIVPLMACLLLFAVALELPFLICLGTRRGYQLKLGIFLVLAFLALAYVFFGDLSILDRVSVDNISEYVKEHQEIYMLAQMLTTLGTLGIYYVSYRIACIFFAGLEREDD